MKIAIIGSGISGLLSARLLAADHEIHVFEANSYAGGHTNTVSFEAFGRQYAADTGFMVFNDRTYPNFVRMLQMLDVPARDSDMSFSVRCDKTGLEYQGSSLNGLFAQRRNLVRPSFYRMLLDVLRFNRQSLELLQGEDYELELGEYLDRNRYSREFIDHYLIPMGAAIWSAPPDRFRQFPARFIVNFFNNHGLLTVRGHPAMEDRARGRGAICRSHDSSLCEPHSLELPRRLGATPPGSRGRDLGTWRVRGFRRRGLGCAL